jgi:hypothetical protein
MGETHLVNIRIQFIAEVQLSGFCTHTERNEHTPKNLVEIKALLDTLEFAGIESVTVSCIGVSD